VGTTPELRALVRANAGAAELRKQMRRAGMTLFADSGLALARAGETTLDEAREAASSR